MASRFHKKHGALKNKDFETYWNECPDCRSKEGPIAFAFSYPIWRLIATYDVYVPPPPPPPEPEKIDYEKWSAELLVQFARQLNQALPNLPESMRESATQAAHDIISEEFKSARQDKLRDAQPVASLVDSFTSLLKNIPLQTDGTYAFAAYLYQVLDVARIDQFFEDLDANKQFPEVSRHYAREASWGFAMTGGSPHVLNMLSMDPIGTRNSPAHVSRNLKNHPHLRRMIIPMAIPKESRFEGTWIIAPHGRGKTTLLSNLINNDVVPVSNGEACVIVMGSKGDLIENLRQARGFAAGQPLDGMLTLIEPSANLALNPLDVGATRAHTTALLEYVFASVLDTEMTALQATVFRKVIWLAQTIPGATLATVRRILLHGEVPNDADLTLLHEEEQEFFAQNMLNKPPYKERRNEISARIDALTSRAPILRDMFAAPKTKIHMAAIMDRPGFVLIDNSVAKLTEQGSEFFSRFIMALILAAAQQRSGRKREDKLPVYVYIDEAQTVIHNDPTIATIIQTCRSQNVGLVLAHQELLQIDEPKVKSALANCAIRLANPDADAEALAKAFRTEPELLQNMEKGEFALFIRDRLRHPIKVAFPNRPVWTWPKMTDEELSQIRAQMQERFCWSRQSSSPSRDSDPDNPDMTPGKW